MFSLTVPPAVMRRRIDIQIVVVRNCVSGIRKIQLRAGGCLTTDCLPCSAWLPSTYSKKLGGVSMTSGSGKSIPTKSSHPGRTHPVDSADPTAAAERIRSGGAEPGHDDPDAAARRRRTRPNLR